jgi:hypothetical protein
MSDGELASVVLAVLWQGSFCVAFCAGVYCTFANIRDPLWNNPQAAGSEPKSFCQWCRCVCCCRLRCFSLIPRRCNVKLESKHCRICNRCVCNFDHHCIWLNVCVARRTYKAFLILLLSLIAACSAHATCSGACPLTFLNSPALYLSISRFCFISCIAVVTSRLVACDSSFCRVHRRRVRHSPLSAGQRPSCNVLWHFGHTAAYTSHPIFQIVGALTHLYLLHCLLMYHVWFPFALTSTCRLIPPPALDHLRLDFASRWRFEFLAVPSSTSD